MQVQEVYLEVTPGNLVGHEEVRWEGKEINTRCIEEQVGFSPTRELWEVVCNLHSHLSLAGAALGPLTPSCLICPTVPPAGWETAPG